MKGYIYDGEKVILSDVPKPVVRPNDVLVRIDKVSICGSDFHIFRNDDWARETVTQGIVIGHEGCGFVEEVGSDVTCVSVGDYVALESHYACPSCERDGKTADYCPHYGIIGIHGTTCDCDNNQVGGVFSEYISIPYYCCHKLSDKIRSKMQGSLLEPAGNSWEIMRFLKKRGLPKSMAIHGCGPHGLNLSLFARHFGVERVVSFEIDERRIEFAKSLGGAHEVIDAREQLSDEKFDVTIDMVGNEKVVDDCKGQVADGGMVILFGLPKHEALIAHGENFAQIIFGNEEMELEQDGKKFTLRGFTGRHMAVWPELLSALENNDFLLDRLGRKLESIGHLDELSAFIENPPKDFLKIGMGAFRCKARSGSFP